jgi:hypothetical protein
MDKKDLENRFGYHAPPNDTVKADHAAVRSLHHLLATQMNELLPDGREKSIVLTKLEESMMWCNAAIARKNPITEPLT